MILNTYQNSAHHHTLQNLHHKFFQIKEKHLFHLVDSGPLPITTATASMLVVLSIVFYLHGANIVTYSFIDNMTFQIAWVIFSSALFGWFLTVIVEAAQGYHTLVVRKGLRFGMVLFIVSEIMFFFAFFWAFFHVSLSPSIAIGGIWPPKSIQSLDVWGLPLLNTILLLSSGVTITLVHRGLLRTTYNTITQISNTDLGLTVLLGLIFLLCQIIEYKYGITFRWKENIYGSTFFVTTGFHGLHVTIGTIFLIFCFLRNIITIITNIFFYIKNYSSFKKIYNFDFEHAVQQSVSQYYAHLAGIKLNLNEKKALFIENWTSPFRMTKDQHLNFETGAWYWHFVDVVWIFLFVTIYWWGS